MSRFLPGLKGFDVRNYCLFRKVLEVMVNVICMTPNPCMNYPLLMITSHTQQFK